MNSPSITAYQFTVKATVSLEIHDVLDRKPDWTKTQARQWLIENCQDITETMTQAANDLLDDLLGSIENADVAP